jgi:hypothetical protein
LITVSQDHPGYIAALMGWSRLVGGSDVSLAYPALIAGVLGPAVLYLTLRALGYARWIGVVLGAALVASRADIAYSGRLKPDTTDVLVVLVLVLVISRLARTTWRWPTAVLWVLAAVVVASISLFALVAVAVAGLVLLLHPVSDLKVRVPAIAVQAGATVALGVAIVDSYNTKAVAAQWRHLWDAFLTFYPDPIRFGSEVLHHLTRIAQVYPGGPAWFATVCVLVALAGLAVEAWRGPRAVVARYLLLLVAVAFVGGLLGRIPFGPSLRNPQVTGGRASLWLVPVMAVGLAAALQRIRSSLDVSGFRLAMDVVAGAGAAIVLGFALEATPLPYPLPGAQPAVNFAESNLGPSDSLLVVGPAYSLAAESHFAPLFEGDPSGFPGFFPVFKDPRIHTDLYGVDPEQVAADVAHAKRVLVYISEPALSSSDASSRSTIDHSLVTLGYQPEVFPFEDASVEVWTHSSEPLPTTSILVPSSGATLSGSTRLDAAASNATKVEYLIFGGRYGYSGRVIGTATQTPYGWVLGWNTGTVPNGSYVVLSEAFNHAGHTFSPRVSIRVKN